MSALVETYASFPFTMTKAHGVFVYDDVGNEYLDLYGGHAVALLGHSPKELIEAIQKQGSELYFYSTLGKIPVRDAAAQALIDYSHKDYKKVFFCNSGAEANENALKLCLQKKKRKKLVGFKKGWHGRTLLCMAVTDDPKWHASMPEWFGPTGFAEVNNESSLSVIDKDTAGVILEPIQSIGGITQSSVNFLKALKKRCDEVGAWLIFDEIQTGLGRIGIPFVSGFSGVSPHMTTLAKGLASGYPIGAVVMTDEVASTIQSADLGSTFGGGPMAMAALKKSLEIISDKNLAKHAASIESYVRETLKHPKLLEIRGSGCLLGLKFSCSAKEIQQALLAKKILTGTSGEPDVLRIMPPLIIETSHIDAFNSALKEIQ